MSIDAIYTNYPHSSASVRRYAPYTYVSIHTDNLKLWAIQSGHTEILQCVFKFEGPGSFYFSRLICAATFLPESIWTSFLTVNDLHAY